MNGALSVFARLRALLRESVASATSQSAASLLTIAMVAGMCAATLLTSGQTAAAESAALASIDAVGTRSIIVRSSEDAGLTSTVVDRLRTFSDTEAVIAFGPIMDTRNSHIPGGTLVPVRQVYGDLPVPPTSGDAFASESGAQALGLLDGAGSVTTPSGQDLVVASGLEVPEYLADLEPLVVSPSPTTPASTVTLTIVIADEPANVEALADAVVGLLDIEDPSKVTVETSQQLAQIRAAVSGELATYGRSTVLGILAVAGLLVAANLFGLVQLRRKDFGRRRALGASRGLIVALLLTQVTVLAACGSVLGTGFTLAGLAMADSPVPEAQFATAVAVAAVLTSLVAALAPAVVAANRDPLHEMRVP